MILNRFAELLPGDTYKKKLFCWNLIQYVGYHVWTFLISGLILLPIPHEFKGWIMLTIQELLTNDGHIYGDLVTLLTGSELRGQVWIFSMLFVTLLSYLWSYRNSGIAKILRTLSYLITLFAYLIYTIFFPMDPRYDYYIWWNLI